MTFGYHSSPINRKSNDRMRDWADELLRQVGYLRTSPEEHEAYHIHLSFFGEIN